MVVGSHAFACLFLTTIYFLLLSRDCSRHVIHTPTSVGSNLVDGLRHLIDSKASEIHKFQDLLQGNERQTDSKNSQGSFLKCRARSHGTRGLPNALVSRASMHV